MQIMKGPLTWALRATRTIGYEVFGYQLVVECNDHTLDVWMQKPVADDDAGRPWDNDLYYRGQMYYQDYADPIKPQVNQTQGGFATDATLDLDEAAADDRPDDLDNDQEETGGGILTATWETETYLDQHLARDLVLPEKQWKYILIACIVIGGFVLLNLAITAYLAGSI